MGQKPLTDFSKLVEVFDAHEVSFVSVTQAFNTTNSMGRLTLNVLLSFAQFEREVTGERIRDKIALSRKRGLWTGGLPPLGYDAIDKKLIVNESEAETVRHIFERYSELKNVRRLQSELRRDGYVSKHRTTRTGKQTGGTPFERGALYTILKNQTYLGLTTHKGETFQGEHEPIIGKAQFDQVQAILTANRKRAASRSGAGNPSLLAGKIKTDNGITLTPTHAQTHGRRYRYYVERRKRDRTINEARPIRLPASEIEQSICSELATFLADPIRLMDELKLKSTAQETQSAISSKAQQIAKRLTAPTLQMGDKNIIMELVKRISIMPEAKGYVLHIDLDALAETLELPCKTNLGDAAITVHMKLKVCNNGKKVIIGNKPIQKPEPNPALITAINSAHQIKKYYLGADVRSLTDIATSMKMNKRQVWLNLKLAFLAPDIQFAILSGIQPNGLCLQDLLQMKPDIDWECQRKILGLV